MTERIFTQVILPDVDAGAVIPPPEAGTIQIYGKAGKLMVRKASPSVEEELGADVGGGTVTIEAATPTAAGVVHGKTSSTNSNTSIGYNSQNAVTTGTNNVAMGVTTQRDLTEGARNVAVGFEAQRSITTGINNVAIGDGAQRAISSGNNNVAIGRNVMQNTTTGIENTGVGSAALANLVTGGQNTAVGNGALNANLGSGNSAFGYLAGVLISTGENNTLLGKQAGSKLTTGINNTVVGSTSLMNNIAGEGNVVVGYSSLTNSTGNNNVVVGNVAGEALTIGSNNVLIGYDSEASSATASNEITLGGYTHARFRIPGLSLDTNAALNNQTLVWSTTGGYGGTGGFVWSYGSVPAATHTAIGGVLGKTSSADSSVGLGYNALSVVNATRYNTAIGNKSSRLVTSGHSNTSVGDSSLEVNVTGHSNTAVGRCALINVTSNGHVGCGIKVGANDSYISTNNWRLCQITAAFNTLEGVQISDDFSAFPLNDSNAGLFDLGDLRSNGGAGLKVDNCFGNTFSAILTDSNGGYGVDFTNKSFKNTFIGGDQDEGNALGVIRNAGVSNTFIGVLSSGFSDIGSYTNILGFTTNTLNQTLIKTQATVRASAVGGVAQVLLLENIANAANGRGASVAFGVPNGAESATRVGATIAGKNTVSALYDYLDFSCNDNGVLSSKVWIHTYPSLNMMGPAADNSLNLGFVGYRWKQTYTGQLQLSTAATAGAAGTVTIGGTTATTVGAAGGASALPATPLGYINAFVAGVAVKIPYYTA